MKDTRNAITIFLVLFLYFYFECAVIHAWPKNSTVRFYHFKVESTSITKLCKTTSIVTVNGKFPGPTIYARQDDRVVIRVTNLSPYNMSIHWHGVRQRRTCWYDGPAYITQCPIQPGRTFTYKFALLNQKGTLFWHAHISWLRATVHGPLIIYPKLGVPYPFDPPHEEHTIMIGEYRLQDIEEFATQLKYSGAGPEGCDAYLLNGHPGPFHNCSQNDVYSINVFQGKTYLLRIINAALNSEHFFSIASHTMTVVEADGEYTTPFQTPHLMLTPGQTYNVLVTANQPIGPYYMAVGPYMPSLRVPTLNQPSYALFNYIGSPKISSQAPKIPDLPLRNNTMFAKYFNDQVLSLPRKGFHYPVNVPLTVDKKLFFTIGLNVFHCNSTPDRCQGPGGGVLGASVNNVSFRKPFVSLLHAYYHNLDEVFTADFPTLPEKEYDFVNGAPNDIGKDTEAKVGTRVSVVEYGQVVEVVFQDTGTVSLENHPVHLHGFSFYVLGTGIGNYDAQKVKVNLVNPPFRNTIGVPVGGWAAIRFRADNPGIWFMHCHLEAHTMWGLSMAFLVKDGEKETQTLPPPPPDLPSC